MIEIKSAFLPGKLIKMLVITIMAREHEQTVRLQHSVNFFEGPDPIVMNHVINPIERDQSEVKGLFIKHAQVPGVTTKDLYLGILLLRECDVARRVVDSGIVAADLK